MLNRNILFGLIAIALVAMASAAPYHPKPVRLRDVETLTFTAGEYTTARRSSAIQKLSCISGPCQYAPTSAMCKNVGWDGTDVQWKCEAELPKGIKLGSISVSCEGYSYPDDDYVLSGSCGLEYSLVGDHPVHQSEYKPATSYFRRFTDWIGSFVRFPYVKAQTDYRYLPQSTWFGDLVTLTALCVVLYLIYRMLSPNYYTSWSLIPGISSFFSWMRQPSAYSGPPPPYYSSAHGGHNDKSYPNYSYSPPPQTSSWSYFPNILSGLAGYALGSWGNRHSYQAGQPAPQPVYVQHPPVNTYSPNQSSYNSAYSSDSIRHDSHNLRNRHVDDTQYRTTQPSTDNQYKTTQTSTAYGSTKRR